MTQSPTSPRQPAQKKPRVAVVGSVNADLIAPVPRLPVPGETLQGGNLIFANGGKGANQAVAAARQGGSVSLIGCVGTDPFGETLRTALSDDGIDVGHLDTVDGVSTGVAIILLDADGQNSIVLSPGANAELSVERTNAAGGTIERADVVLCQLEVPLSAVHQAMTIARAARVPVILNPAPASEACRDLIPMADIVVPNESEAALLTGIEVTDMPSAHRAADALIAQGPSLVLLTLGKGGVLAATREGTEHHPAFDVSPVDTTAAGDSFVGAFAVAWASGHPLDEALIRAQAAAALAVTEVGAQPSIPTAEKTITFLRDFQRTGMTGPIAAT